MAPGWKYKNHPADRSLKEDLSINSIFDPSYILWDTPFKLLSSKGQSNQIRELMSNSTKLNQYFVKDNF